MGSRCPGCQRPKPGGGLCLACTLRAARGAELPEGARCAHCGCAERQRLHVWVQGEVREVLCAQDLQRMRSRPDAPEAGARVPPGH